MTTSTVNTILNAGITGLNTYLTALLPVILPVAVGLAVLFAIWFWIKGAAGRSI